MWVEQWVDCAKSLCQWGTLDEYARSTYNYELAMDCQWRLSEWPKLKDTMSKVVQVGCVCCTGMPFCVERVKGG